MSVSLAFKGSPKISGATRRRIFEVAEKLNYVPNQAARQLRTRKDGYCRVHRDRPRQSVSFHDGETCGERIQ